jgi:hypothetical protein
MTLIVGSINLTGNMTGRGIGPRGIINLGSGATDSRAIKPYCLEKLVISALNVSIVSQNDLY